MSGAEGVQGLVTPGHGVVAAGAGAAGAGGVVVTLPAAAAASALGFGAGAVAPSGLVVASPADAAVVPDGPLPDWGAAAVDGVSVVLDGDGAGAYVLDTSEPPDEGQDDEGQDDEPNCASTGDAPSSIAAVTTKPAKVPISRCLPGRTRVSHSAPGQSEFALHRPGEVMPRSALRRSNTKPSRLADAIRGDGRLCWAVVLRGGIIGATPPMRALLRARARAWSVLLDPTRSDVAPGEPRTLTEIVQELVRRRQNTGARFMVARGEQRYAVLVRRVSVPGRRRAAVVIFMDVSDLEAERHELRESNEKLTRHDRVGLVGQVALGLAHDLGNILGALRLRIEVLASNVVVRRQAGQHIGALVTMSEEARTLLSRMQRLAGGEDRPRARPMVAEAPLHR